jgi:hypothetical protein
VIDINVGYYTNWSQTFRLTHKSQGGQNNGTMTIKLTTGAETAQLKSIEDYLNEDDE